MSAWLDGIRQATLRGDAARFRRGSTAVSRAASRRWCASCSSLDPVASRRSSPGQLGADARRGVAAAARRAGSAVPRARAVPGAGRGAALRARRRHRAPRARARVRARAWCSKGVRGVGKTSLAVAGLVPYLALRGVDGKDDWIAVRIVPGAAPDRGPRGGARGDRRPSSKVPTRRRSRPTARPRRSGSRSIVDPLDDVLAAPAEARARASRRWSRRSPRPRRASIASRARASSRRCAARRRACASSPRSPTSTPRRCSRRDRSDRACARRCASSARRRPRPCATSSAAPAHFAGVPLIGVDDIAADVQRELRAGGARLPYVALALRAFWDASADRGKRGARLGALAAPSSLSAGSLEADRRRARRDRPPRRRRVRPARAGLARARRRDAPPPRGHRRDVDRLGRGRARGHLRRPTAPRPAASSRRWCASTSCAARAARVELGHEALAARAGRTWPRRASRAWSGSRSSSGCARRGSPGSAATAARSAPAGRALRGAPRAPRAGRARPHRGRSRVRAREPAAARACAPAGGSSRCSRRRGPRRSAWPQSRWSTPRASPRRPTRARGDRARAHRRARREIAPHRGSVPQGRLRRGGDGARLARRHAPDRSRRRASAAWRAPISSRSST